MDRCANEEESFGRQVFEVLFCLVCRRRWKKCIDETALGDVAPLVHHPP